MTPRRILMINALSTTACALAVLALRRELAPLFGLDTPLVLDIVAIVSLGYAGLLASAAGRVPVAGATLMAFAVVDAVWVAASALLLALCWPQLAPVARWLVIAVALVVEVFAALQYRAASAARGRMLRTA
jgi:hypothetical protein